MIIDKKHRLWCQNFTGQIFYVENDTFHLFKDFTKENAYFPIFNIKEDSLILNIGYTAVYDIKQKTLVSKYKNIDDETKQYFEFINVETQSDEIYVNSKENFYYKPNGKPYRSILKKDEYFCYNFKKVNGIIYSILRNLKTKKWLLVQLKNGQTTTLKEYPPATFPSNIYMIKSVQDGFAVCTVSGVYLLDNQFNVTRQFLSNEKITDVLYDKEGNLWLTSLQNGLYVMPSIELNTFTADFFPSRAKAFTVC